MTLHAAAVLVLLAAGPTRAADLADLARQLGRAASAAGVRRVAVSSLRPVRGGASARGSEIAERLIVALVRDGRVQAVERSLLGSLASEAALGQTGAVAGGAGAVRLADADGLLVGRYQSDNGTLRVFARVVDPRDGVIVAAGEAVLDDASPDDPFTVPVPVLRGDFPPLDGELRDAPADEAGADCAGARERVAHLQEGLLDLKARYWAFRLRLGVDAAQVTSTPGATIPDAEQRARFYERLNDWHRAVSIPALSEADLARLATSEGTSYELVRDCGL